jgi:hypothetical protein
LTLININMEDHNPGNYLKNPSYKNTHTSEAVHSASNPTDCITTEHVKKVSKNHSDTVSSQQQINK